MQVKLPDGTFSTNFPFYYGSNDDLTDAERAARGPDMPVARAPKLIQELFDRQLAQIAKRQGYKDAQHYIDTALEGVLYHFTLNFMAAHTLTHGDEYNFDGPGLWTWNLILQIRGLFYFLDAWARADGVQLGLWGVQLQRGDCTGFSGTARNFLQHGVLRTLPIHKLPKTKQEMEADPSYKTQVRIVATIRGGLLSEADKNNFDNHFATKVNNEGNEGQQQVAPVSPAQKKAVSPAQKKPSKKKSTPKKRPGTRKAGAETRVAVSASTTLVSAQYAHLPEVGSILNSKSNSKFGAVTVLGVHANFLLTDKVAGRDVIVMREGIIVRMKIPPLDDRVQLMLVVAAGEIWGRAGTSTRYRVVVMRRKNEGEKTWGPLETLDAGAFPDEAHCQVTTMRAHKHSTHVQQKPTYTIKE
jgi:hypothetical protein